MDVPVYYSHRAMEALIENYPAASDPAKFYKQLRRLEISHILAPHGIAENGGKVPKTGYQALRNMLISARCMEPVKALYMNVGSSRTLPTLDKSTTQMNIYALRPELCRL